MVAEGKDARIAQLDPFTVAGPSLRGTEDADFEKLWARLDDRREEYFARAVAEETYGVTVDADESTEKFTYVAGVVVDATDDLPEGAAVVDVPGGTCAVFEATVSDLEATYEWIMGGWIEGSAFELREGPFLERYGSEWGPEAAFEILVPVTVD